MFCVQSQQLAAAAAKELERKKRTMAPTEHRHFVLSIEVPKPESYTVTVQSEDVLNRDCDARGPPSASDGPGELKRSISSLGKVSYLLDPGFGCSLANAGATQGLVVASVGRQEQARDHHHHLCAEHERPGQRAALLHRAHSPAHAAHAKQAGQGQAAG